MVMITLIWLSHLQPPFKKAWEDLDVLHEKMGH
jgi:hypothetical protein